MIHKTSKGSVIATHSQIDKVPWPNWLKFMPKTEVTNEMGRKMKVRRVVAFVRSATRAACSFERLFSSMEVLLMIVDLPASQSSMMLWIRVERYPRSVCKVDSKSPSGD